MTSCLHYHHPDERHKQLYEESRRLVRDLVKTRTQGEGSTWDGGEGLLQDKLKTKDGHANLRVQRLPLIGFRARVAVEPPPSHINMLNTSPGQREVCQLYSRMGGPQSGIVDHLPSSPWLRAHWWA
jgi:hypothetical protein